jgi:hypothetical protein
MSYVNKNSNDDDGVDGDSSDNSKSRNRKW